MKLQSLFESSGSATLRQVQADFEKSNNNLKKAGMRSGENPDIKAFAPNDQYPSPWRVSGNHSGPVSILANNGKTVAKWLTASQADKVLTEI